MTSTSSFIKTLRQSLRHFSHTIVLLAILLIAFPIVSIANNAHLNVRIFRVVDGDTVKLLDDDRVIHTIRLAGIDAPESKMPYGKQATAFLTGLILGKAVVAVPYKQDRYGRTIATIFLHEKDINLAIIDAGLAWHYKKYASEQPRFEAMAYAHSELMARQNKLALWSDEEPIAPWEWRSAHQKWRNGVPRMSMLGQPKHAQLFY